MYHYVRDREPPLSDGVKGLREGEFEKQLDQLSTVATPIDWPTFYAWQRGEGTIPDRSFLLTFDDGLADQAEIVVPILNRRNLSGVFFVPACVLVNHRLLPPHQVHLLLATLGLKRFAQALFDELHRLDEKNDWPSRMDEGQALHSYYYESPLRAKLKFLLTQMLPIPLRNAALDRLFNEHVGEHEEWAQRWYCSADQLRDMQSAGHTIGGHSFSHDPLTRLTASECRDDINRCAGILGDVLGWQTSQPRPGVPDRATRPFSFPFGCYNDGVCQAVADARFAAAFTTEARPVANGCDLYRLPRVDTIAINTEEIANVE